MNGQLDTCHCCEGLTAQTPATVTNRAGLSAIAYRVGTHSEFKKSMLAALSDVNRPALQNLKTRDDDDFSIALLDAAATMADVLTFYQERIANESYLRTATERRSLLELARLIGYELRPGVAASTFLAFTMDETPGAPLETTVNIGTKVQSVPGPDEKPQTFETVEKITARVEWNALRPQTTQTFVPKFGDTHVYLKGTATNLKPGDAILLVGPEREADSDSERWDFRRVTKVTPDFDANRTRLDWAEGLGTAWPHFVLPSANPKVYALRVRASLFGFNAPHPLTLSNDVRSHYGFTDGSDWSFKINDQTIDLDTTYPGILKDSWLVLSEPNDPYQELYSRKLGDRSGASQIHARWQNNSREFGYERKHHQVPKSLPRDDGVRAKRIARDGRATDHDSGYRCNDSTRTSAVRFGERAMACRIRQRYRDRTSDH
jgi:hypothetical protein